MKFIFLILLLFFKSPLLFSQNREFQISTNLTYSKMDLFIGCSVIYQGKTMDNELSLNTGINRTFFQNTLFPMIQYNFTYNLFKNNRWTFGPSLFINMAFLNLRTTKSNFHYYPEILAGYKIKYGKKFGLIHKSSLGVILEGFKDDTSKFRWFNTLSYNINLGVYYAID